MGEKSPKKEVLQDTIMLSVKIGHYHPSLENSFISVVQTLKKDDPLMPLAVVAPTNWMLNRLQERLVQENGASFLNISFLNFSVLAKEICRRWGIVAGQTVQESVIYENIIAGLLRQHRGAAPSQITPPSLPALAQALFQVIQDLIDANVRVDDLTEAIREGFVERAEEQKLSRVIHLYDLFQQKLKTLNICHYSDVFRAAASCVSDSGFLGNFQRILAYGFYDLTGVEQDFFGEIFRTYPTIFFLPYRKKHPAFAYVKPFFESFVLGLAQDVEELPPESVTGFSCLMDPKSVHESMTSCESRIHNPKPEIRNLKPVVISASGKRDDVWTVAKEILKLAGAGYKMEEIGVVARTLEPYTDPVKKIFQENNIPFSTSAQEPVGKYPLVKMIQHILLLKREDFYRPMVIELLGSPYFTLPVRSAGETIPRPDLWDILSRRLHIRANITCWLSRLKQAKIMSVECTEDINSSPSHLPPSHGTTSGNKNVFFDEEESGRHIPIPASQIELLHNVLSALSNDLSAIPERASWATMSQKITHFLRSYISLPAESINTGDNTRDLMILEKIGKLLHTFSGLNCLGEEVTMDQFVDTFINACRQESIPVGLGNGRGVKVLDAMSARGIPFRALFVLGLNEKMFPRAISEEPFLRDHLRRRLSEVLGNFIPEKLRGFDEERLLFSFLLNAAGERLYLIHERSDEAGKPKVQSHYLMDILQNIRRISGAAEKPQEKPGYEIYVPRGIKDKLCGQEISLLTPREVGIRMALDRIDPAFFMKAFGIARDAFKRSRSALDFMEAYNPCLTRYDGVVGDMSQWWNGQACRGLSPTTLETLGICPFKFFMRKILELESLEEPETAETTAAVDIGTLYHSILRDFYHTLIENNYFNVKGHKLNSVAQNSHDRKTPPSSPPCEGVERGRGKTRDEKKAFLHWNPTELLQSIAQKYFTEIEQQIPIPYPVVWEIEKEEILVLLIKFVTWDIEHSEQTGYIPTYLEKTIKLSQHNDVFKLIPGDSKEEDTSPMTFKGKIDRIDIKKEQNALRFRVIDYKSGRFFKDNILKTAIRGQKLQLPFYIIMAEYLLSEAIKNGRIPEGHVNLDEASFVYVAQDMEEKKGRLSPQKKTIGSNDWRENKEQCRETLREFLRIIREGIFPISPAEDPQRCGWCEFAITCRRGNQPLRFRLERDVRLKKFREIMKKNDAGIGSVM